MTIRAKGAACAAALILAPALPALAHAAPRAPLTASADADPTRAQPCTVRWVGPPHHSMMRGPERRCAEAPRETTAAARTCLRVPHGPRQLHATPAVAAPCPRETRGEGFVRAAR